jgi:branched-chain amino acid transport system permease protein
LQLVVEVVLGGVITGLLFVLVALGFNLIFGIMDIINFAQGYLVMWGGYLMYLFSAKYHLNFALSVVLGSVVLGLAGVLLELGLFRRVVGMPFSSLVISLGLGFILQNLALIAFGPDPLAVESPVNGVVHIFGATLPVLRLVVAGIAIVALLLVYLFIGRTSHGRALRAVAQDPEAAALQGIDRGRVYSLTFGLGALLAGLGGTLLGPLLSVNIGMGDAPLLSAFIVVVIGGLGSMAGTAVAGILLGILSSVSILLVGSGAADLIGFAAMFLFLLFRPQGIFGKLGERV